MLCFKYSYYIHFDTTTIALLSSLLTSNRLNKEEFEEVKSQIQILSPGENNIYTFKSPNDPSNVKL